MAFKGSAESSSSELNFIGKGTVVNGELHTESSLRVDGTVKGKIICKSTLTIGETGKIEGEIQATNAIVGGKIEGKIFVNQKLVLESKSSLIGELKASKLIIDEGAVFQGSSDMGVGQTSGSVPSKNQPLKSNEQK
ncbi:MAG: polymer-forming cytoskeletal protein [Caldisericaceae bacterium]|nr:polymer-forming cytoskeletal protein [Caldisericaceae bacterium]